GPLSAPRDSYSQDPQEVRQHNVGIEVLPRDVRRGPTMAAIVGIDALDGRGRLVEGCEAEQTVPRRPDVAEPRFLAGHRPAGRLVSWAAVTEPAAAEPYVLVLGNRELAPGLRDVPAVRVRVAGEVSRWDYAPAVPFEQLSVGLVVPGQGQLERRAGPPR